MPSLQLFDLWCALQIPLHLKKKKMSTALKILLGACVCFYKKKKKQESKQGEDIWVMRIGLKNAGLFPE